MNTKPLSRHTLAHVLTELVDMERDSGRRFDQNEIEIVLREQGYLHGPVTAGRAVLDQVWEVWNTIGTVDTRPKLLAARAVGVSDFGDSTIILEPMMLSHGDMDDEPAVSIGLRHHRVAISVNELERLVEELIKLGIEIREEFASDQTNRAVYLRDRVNKLDVNFRRELLVQCIEQLAIEAKQPIPVVLFDLAQDALVEDDG